VKDNDFGGYEKVDSQPESWTSGDYWNVDSNIKIWGEHEVRRNAASDALDVHRHDQISRVVLEPHPGTKTRNGKEPAARQSISGVVSAGSSFLEAFGFDLGLRDRQARCTTLWKPASGGEMFRSQRSFQRDVPRISEYNRTLRRTKSTPGFTFSAQTPGGVVTLRQEEIGGEIDDGDEVSERPGRMELTSMAQTCSFDVRGLGRTHGSRSCRYWDRWDHTSKREAARSSNGTYSPAFAKHPEEYPYYDGMVLSPAARYTLKYKRFGEAGLRQHVQASQQEERIGRTRQKGRT